MASNSKSSAPDEEQQPSSIYGADISLYQIIGVKLNATQSDIKQAYHNKAKQLHPDKNPEISEDLFKNVAKAYEILSDQVKRTEYNENMDNSEYETFDLEDPIGSLLSGARKSEEWRKKYEEWLNTKSDEGIGKFMDALKKSMDDFQKVQFSYLIDTRKEKQTAQDIDSHEADISGICDEMMNSVSDAVNNTSALKATEEHNEALQKVIYRMQTTSGEPKTVDTQVPILDFECLSDNDLRTFLSNFVSEDENAQLSKLKRNELLEKIHIYVPQAKVQTLSNSIESAKCCTKCKEKFMFLINPLYIIM